MVLSSLVDTTPTPASCVCSPPVSEGPGLTHNLPALGAFQQPATVVSLRATLLCALCLLSGLCYGRVRVPLVDSQPHFPWRPEDAIHLFWELKSYRLRGLRCEEPLDKEYGVSGNRP